MAIRVEFDVDEVVDGLKQVTKLMGPKVHEAMELGSNLVAARAKSEHGYTDITGAATNSVSAEPVTGSFASGDLEAIVAGGAEHYAYLEFGTKAHKIRPKHRKALRFATANGFAFAKEVSHPGTQAYAPLANALEHEFAQITEVIADSVDAAFAEAGFPG